MENEIGMENKYDKSSNKCLLHEKEQNDTYVLVTEYTRIYLVYQY
jgi:hypothetical protein